MADQRFTANGQTLEMSEIECAVSSFASHFMWSVKSAGNIGVHARVCVCVSVCRCVKDKQRPCHRLF